MPEYFNTKSIGQFLKNEWTLLLMAAAFLVLVFLVIMSYRSQSDNLLKLAQMQSDINQLKSRASALQQSQAVSVSELEGASQVLSQLVPDSEDSFSIIYALEKIASASGFIIDSYSLSPKLKGMGKVTVDIRGSGDINAFMKFLEVYKFAGSRFVTSDKMDYSGSKAVAKTITLNFYSDKAVVDETNSPQLTEKDIAFFNEIKSKVNIVLKEEATQTLSTDSLNYQTVENPF